MLQRNHIKGYSISNRRGDGETCHKITTKSFLAQKTAVLNNKTPQNLQRNKTHEVIREDNKHQHVSTQVCLCFLFLNYL